MKQIKISNTYITIISIFLAVAGITILYIAPNRSVNKLLFFIAISIAVTIHLLRMEKILDLSFFKKKWNIIWLGSIVLIAGIAVYLLLFTT